MKQPAPLDIGFLHKIFDAVPAALFLVDEDVRIQHINASASKHFGFDVDQVYQKRGGEVLHCIHAAEVPEGCGRAPACKDCVIRNAVTNACSGKSVYRSRTRVEIRDGEKKGEVYLLVTAAPFVYQDRPFVLLTLEDISELVQLKRCLPICANCKKIRDDEGYWNDVADYFRSHLEVEFSHGLCKECLEKLYPELIE